VKVAIAASSEAKHPNGDCEGDWDIEGDRACDLDFVPGIEGDLVLVLVGSGLGVGGSM
jgi:hypothetical protein